MQSWAFSLRPGLQSRMGNKLSLYLRWHPGGSPFTLQMLFNFLVLSVAASFESQIKVSKPACLIGSKAVFPLPVGQMLLNVMCMPLFQSIQGQVHLIPSPVLTSSTSFCLKHLSPCICSPGMGSHPSNLPGPQSQDPAPPSALFPSASQACSPSGASLRACPLPLLLPSPAGPHLLLWPTLLMTRDTN